MDETLNLSSDRILNERMMNESIFNVIRLDSFYSLLTKFQLHPYYRWIVHYRSLLSCNSLKRSFLLRPSLLANMTIKVCLTMACSILSANWIINHIEFSRGPQLILKHSNFRPMKPSCTRKVLPISHKKFKVL